MRTHRVSGEPLLSAHRHATIESPPPLAAVALPDPRFGCACAGAAPGPAFAWQARPARLKPTIQLIDRWFHEILTRVEDVTASAQEGRSCSYVAIKAANAQTAQLLAASAMGAFTIATSGAYMFDVLKQRRYRESAPEIAQQVCDDAMRHLSPRPAV